jgi:hypothetical protein
MKKNILLLVLFSLLKTFLANAEELHDEWNQLASLPKGKKLVVHLKSGGDISGEFARAEPQQIFMMRKNEEIRLKKENVSLIIAGKRFSGKKVLVGAAIGFGAGMAFGACMGHALDEGYSNSSEKIGLATGLGLIGVGVGTAIAANQRPQEEILYRSFSKQR